MDGAGGLNRKSSIHILSSGVFAAALLASLAESGVLLWHKNTLFTDER
jgi:hypothetical protein